jgi:hypothetical protein
VGNSITHAAYGKTVCVLCALKCLRDQSAESGFLWGQHVIATKQAVNIPSSPHKASFDKWLIRRLFNEAVSAEEFMHDRTKRVIVMNKDMDIQGCCLFEGHILTSAFKNLGK